MATTLKQIAAVTGLSIPTVHQILNKYDVPFAEATRKKVLAAAAELDYRPNIAAQSLVRQRSFLVGVLFYGANFSIVTQFMSGVQAAVKANRCAPIFLTHGSVAEERENLESVMARRVDGLIVNAAIEDDGATNGQRLQELHRTGLPMVEVFGHFVPGVVNVTLDYRAAARVATERLVAEGHQRIALLIREQYRETDPDQIGGRIWTAVEFWRGYQAAMKHAGLKVQVQDYATAPDYAAPLDDRRQSIFLGASLAMPTLFKDPKNAPTALVCYSVEAAEAAIRYFELSAAPSDQTLTVAAFGHVRSTASNRVTVVSLRLPVEKAGQLAGDAIFEQLADRRVKNITLGPVME